MSDPRVYVVARNAANPHDLTEEYAICYPGMSSIRWTDNPIRATYWDRDMAEGFIVSLEVSEDAENPRYRYHLVETGAFDPSHRSVESPWPFSTRQ